MAGGSGGSGKVTGDDGGSQEPPEAASQASSSGSMQLQVLQSSPVADAGRTAQADSPGVYVAMREGQAGWTAATLRPSLEPAAAGSRSHRVDMYSGELSREASNGCFSHA